MGKIHAHEFITPFSPFWWECILIVGLIIFVIVRIPLHWKNLKRRNYDLFIACVLILNNIAENWYNYSTGYWSLQQNLPAHLCNVTYQLQAMDGGTCLLLGPCGWYSILADT